MILRFELEKQKKAVRFYCFVLKSRKNCSETIYCNKKVESGGLFGKIFVSLHRKGGPFGNKHKNDAIWMKNEFVKSGSLRWKSCM